MIGHRLTVIFDSVRASPIYKRILSTKLLWPSCGQSFLFPAQGSRMYRTLLWWISKWLATDWPPFLTPSERVLYTSESWVENYLLQIGHAFFLRWPICVNSFSTQDSPVSRTRSDGVKNCGQSAANHLVLKIPLLLRLALMEAKIKNDWPQIGRHFWLRQSESYIQANLE